MGRTYESGPLKFRAPKKLLRREEVPLEHKFAHVDDFASLGCSDGVDEFVFRLNSPGSFFNSGGKGVWDSSFNSRLLLKGYVGSERPRYSHVCVLFNGLDETPDGTSEVQHLFGFYDNLGRYLARQGMLALLLPSPNHLNRALFIKDALSSLQDDEIRARARSPFVDLSVPTNALILKPHSILSAHYQAFRELAALVRSILSAVGRQDEASKVFAAVGPNFDVTTTAFGDGLRTVGKEAMEYFREWLQPYPLHFTLIGYSLGGLRAMTAYARGWLESLDFGWEPVFSACAAINSGGSLPALTAPQWVDRDSWGRMIDRLVVEEPPPPHAKEFFGSVVGCERDYDRHTGILRDVFFGNCHSLSSLAAQDPRATQGLLFVRGGNDEIVNWQSFERVTSRLMPNIYQVAGKGHMFRHGEWGRWQESVMSIVATFAKNTVGDMGILSPREVCEHIALADHEYGVLAYDTHLDPGHRWYAEARQRAEAGIKDNKECAFVLRQFAHLRDFLDKGQCKPGLYRTVRRDLLFGSHIPGIESAALVDSWNRLGSSGKRIGQTMVDGGWITARLRDEALASQKTQLDRLHKRMEWRRARPQG